MEVDRARSLPRLRSKPNPDWPGHYDGERSSKAMSKATASSPSAASSRRRSTVRSDAWRRSFARPRTRNETLDSGPVLRALLDRTCLRVGQPRCQRTMYWVEAAETRDTAATIHFHLSNRSQDVDVRISSDGTIARLTRCALCGIVRTPWINARSRQATSRMQRRGRDHSIASMEGRRAGRRAYGRPARRGFLRRSMVSLKPDAPKVAWPGWSRGLIVGGFRPLDCSS